MTGLLAGLGLAAAFDRFDEPAILIVIIFAIVAVLILGLCSVRIVIALMKAASRMPISKPETWLI